MAKATLTISSKNYSSWSLRGWLLTKFSGLEFEEIVTAPDDPSARAEILLLSSSILVPCLRHEGATIWDTLAIAEYLNEIMPEAGLLPPDRIHRAHCRSICGEIHSGFTTLRASLPVNLKGHFPGFKIWTRAQADIDRVCTIWRECLAESGGPFLFGERTMADAMYAPVVTRFMTYDVKLEPRLKTYADLIMAMPEMADWIAAAQAEPEEIEELEVEYYAGGAGCCLFEGLKSGQALHNFVPALSSVRSLVESRHPRGQNRRSGIPALTQALRRRRAGVASDRRAAAALA
jgi:glutathione S-transferase